MAIHKVMIMNQQRIITSQFIDSILAKYYSESIKGITEIKSPSQLSRGEGIESDYYIFKIDLCGSTNILKKRRPATYLKLAHVFLSSVDHINRQFGADGAQVEYAGDSVLSYFPSAKTNPLNVICSAYLSKLLVDRLSKLDTTMGNLNFKSKTVMHHGKLILSKIGPRGDSSLIAIGYPIHIVSKIENDMSYDSSWATIEFANQLQSGEKRNFLERQYEEKKVLVPPQNTAQNTYASRLSRIQNPVNPAILESVKRFSRTVPQVPKKEIEGKLKGYKLQWLAVNKYLHKIGYFNQA